MPPVVVTRSVKQVDGSVGAKPYNNNNNNYRFDHDHDDDSADDLPGHHHHYQHDNNNNNNNSNNNNGDINDDNNGGNNGRVRLLIAPVVAERSCGSKQQVVGAPTATATTTSELVEQRRQQLRSHQQMHPVAQNNRQKIYHHYDYYTESDLTGSLPIANRTANHYEDNILLFATEHNSNSQVGNNNSNSNNNNNNNGSVVQKRDASKQRQVTQYLNGTHHKQQQQQQQHQQLTGAYALSTTYPDVANQRATKQSASSSSQLLMNAGNPISVGQTGRFVNYYPSWRQTQSPTTGHYKNYSFHVPLHLQGQQPRQHLSYNQSRYSFVTPISSQKQVALGANDLQNSSYSKTNNGGYNNNNNQQQQQQRLTSFSRSRTISHLPNMVKISVEDTTPDFKPEYNNDFAAAATLQLGHNTDCQYEDFYDRPFVKTRQQSFIRSDGDLLKAHLVDLRLPDEGLDNPFKPGTELSWEADMMVRLMKRGYPVQELPLLVQTAKQVARDKGSSKQLVSANDIQVQNDGSVKKPATKIIAKTKDSAKASTWSHKMTRSSSGFDRFEKRALERGEIDPKLLSGNDEQLVRRQSSNDLRSGKQVWANSLSRAKSMPHKGTDADSIDKLISSIELEMSELLKLEAGVQQVGAHCNDVDFDSRLLQKEAANKTSISSALLTGSRRGEATVSVSNKQKRKFSEQKQQQQRTSIKNQSGKSSRAESRDDPNPESNTADLNRCKTKRNNARCCIIQ